MKNILMLLFIVTGLFRCAHAPEQLNLKPKDGFYLVTHFDNDSLPALKPGEIAIKFNHHFIEPDSGEPDKLLIDTMEYVPLILEKLPVAEQETSLKKKLLISLTPEASAKVGSFTAKHVMQHVAIVVDGEAITMHKIREAITGGKIQITRCDDNACEYLFARLKNNLKK